MEPHPAPLVEVWLSGAGAPECRPIAPATISDHLHQADRLLLVRLRDPGEGEFRMLKEEFGFHRLALEDAAAQRQRPKVDEYPGYVFVVLYAPVPGEDLADVRAVEVDLFIGRNFLVVIHRGEVPAVEEGLARWQRTEPELRAHKGFMVHTLVDALVDAYFPVVDALEDRLDDVELGIFAGKDARPEELLNVKRSLFTLRRATYPMREVFNVFLRRDQALFDVETRPYFQDVYDHVLRLLDTIDIQRDMATGTLDAHLAVISNRLNDTMKRLTVIAICVAVMSAVFGAWGMNFDEVPLQHLGIRGFLLLLGGVTLLVGLALLWTKKRHLW
jgi:magnesium transporter